MSGPVFRGSCPGCGKLVEADHFDAAGNCSQVSAPDAWATNEWHRTLVTPLFVGGPADGHRDKPRPRCELQLRFEVPTIDRGEIRWEDLGDPHVEQQFAFDVYVYHLGVYVDAFTVEYR